MTDPTAADSKARYDVDGPVGTRWAIAGTSSRLCASAIGGGFEKAIAELNGRWNQGIHPLLDYVLSPSIVILRQCAFLT